MEKLSFTPTQDWLVFEVKEIDKKTKGGVIKSPAQIKEEEDNGKKDKFLKVLSIGGECKFTKVGDGIMISGGALEVVIDGKKYGVTREYNIILSRPKEGMVE